MPGLTRVWIVLAGAVVTGGLSAILWSQLAQPAQWQVRDAGLVLTEEASQGQFAVVVVFTLIGVLASLVWSIGATVVLRDLGWPLVLVAVGGSLLAALVAWRLGVLLGPPPPGSVSGLSVGDTVPGELVLDSVAPFVMWPAAALMGVLLATWGRQDERAIDPTTASVIDVRS